MFVLSVKTCLLILSTGVLLGSCQSPADQALSEFKKIDSSLSQKAKTTDMSIQDLTKLVDPIMAGLINTASDSLHAFIENLKINLSRIADKLDDNDRLSPVNKYMIDQKKGDTLFAKIENYQQVCLSMLFSEGDEQYINDLFTGVRQNKRMEETMFRNMPVEAALTLLSKFQFDIKLAQKRVLTRYAVSN